MAVRFGDILTTSDILTKSRNIPDHAGESLFRTLADLMLALCWMADADGWIFWYNRRWYGYTGTAPAKMEGWGWLSVHDPTALPQVLARWRQSLATGEPFEMTFSLKGRDGKFRPFLTRATPVRAPDGHIIRWLGANTDVSEAIEREGLQRQAEERWRALTNALPHIVWVHAQDGSCIYVNKRLENYTGVPAEKHFGAGFLDAVHPDDRSRWLEAWRAALEEGTGFDLELRLRSARGEYRWFEKRVLPLHDEYGAVAQWIGTSTDIDDAVEARELLKRNRAELERLVYERTQELQQAQEKLHRSEKLTALGQLTGGVAHDFNNIIQVVTGGAELLKRPQLSEEKRNFILEGILRGCANAKRLVDQLLAFGRRQALRPEVFDLNKRVEGLADMLRHTLGSGIKVDTELAPDLCRVYADPSQLEVAVLNLALNARDAMPDKRGTLKLSAHNVSFPAAPDRQAGDYVCFGIEDNGAGMSREVLARVFEPFFTTKERGKGTGLGLAQVHGFIKQSGGDVEVDSEPGKGTKFALYLPCATAEHDRSALDQSSAAVDLCGKSVLLADDNADVAAIAADLLEQLGCAVRRAACAEEVLDILDKGVEVDAVLSDIVMTGMSGIELAAKLREQDPSFPIVLATGYSQMLARWSDELPAEVVHKPYSAVEIEAALRRAFQAKAIAKARI